LDVTLDLDKFSDVMQVLKALNFVSFFYQFESLKRLRLIVSESNKK